MKKTFLALTILLFTAINANAMVSVTTIAAEELKKMLDDKANFKLIDARGEKAFKAEHISGAVSLPADKVDAETLGKIAPEVETKLVFYCQDPQCTASHIAAQKALGAGYQYVYRYPNGIADWKEHGFPTDKAAK